MIPPRISLITQDVADLVAAWAFHARPGWAEHPDSQPGVAVFQLAGQVLALFGQAGGHAAFAAARAAGAVARKAPERAPRAAIAAPGPTPGGHARKVAVNPDWPQGAEGRLTLPDRP